MQGVLYLRSSTVRDFVTDDINTTVTGNGNNSLKITKINTLHEQSNAFSTKGF